MMMGAPRRVRADEAALRRDARRRRARAAAHDAGAQAGAGDRRRRGHPRQGGAGRGGRVLHRRHRRPGRGRQPGRGGDPREAPAAARSAPSRHRVRRPSRPRAVHALRSAVDGGNFSVTLLDGVTGSGKTEVYFEAVARTLERGQQALIMLPEIALTSQFMDRFEARFGCAAGRMALGAVGPGARPRLARGGDGRGARRRRRPLGAVPAVQRSRPHRRRRGARRRLQAGGPRALPGARHGGGARQPRQVPGGPRLGDAVDRERTSTRAPAAIATSCCRAATPAPSCPTSPPSICARRRPSKGKWLSPVLVDAVTETLADGQQALLFLNRRGYAPLTLCRSCGHRIDCPQCTAWLVEHRFRGKLNCHHCGFSLPMPEKCPKCGEPGVARRLRPGRGAHRRGGGRALSRGARRPAVVRPRAGAHRDARDHQQHRGGRGTTSSSARRWWPRATTSRSSRPSASSTAIWGWRRAPIRAPASARSSSCIR